MYTRRLDALEADIRRIADAEGQTTRHVSADIIYEINAAIRRLGVIANENGHQFSLSQTSSGTLTAGSENLTTPPTQLVIYDLTLNDGTTFWSLDEMPLRELAYWRAQPRGLPQVYRVMSIIVGFTGAGNAKIYPIPDRDLGYTFTYLANTFQLDVAADTFDATEDEIDWVTHEVAIQLKVRDKDIDRVQLLSSRQAVIEERMRKHTGRRNRAMPIRRRDTRGMREHYGAIARGGKRIT